jgi:REP-associated tyrosine transposase
MGHSYTTLLYHIVFSTKERQPWLDTEMSARLYDYVGGAIRSEGGTSLGINGCPDHIHLLARLRQDKAVSDFLRAIKANSSGWIHRGISRLARVRVAKWIWCV